MEANSVKTYSMSVSTVGENESNDTLDSDDLPQMERLLPADLLRDVSCDNLSEEEILDNLPSVDGEAEISKRQKLLELCDNETPLTQAHTTTINDVPDEILVQILSYVTVLDLVKHVPLVCRRWQCVVEDSEVWCKKVFELPFASSAEFIVDVLRQAPKLQGIYVSAFFKSHALRSICTALNSFQSCLKEIHITVKVGTCEFVSEVLMRHKELIEVLDLCIFERFWDFDFELAQEYTRLFASIGMCQNLKTLTLSGFAPSLFTKKGFVRIAQFCTQLRRLDITNYDDDSNDSLKRLLKRNVDSIRCLSLSWSFLHSELAFAEVAQHCQKLQKLCVVKPHGFSINSFHIETLKNMVYLKELSLPDVKVDILRAFVDVIESGVLKDLEKLDLRYNSWVRNSLLDSVVRECPKLNTLDLQYCYDLTSPGFESLHLLKHLWSLCLEGCCGLCDKVLPLICICEELRHLNLRRIFTFSRGALLNCHGKLRHLRVFLYDLPPVKCDNCCKS